MSSTIPWHTLPLELWPLVFDQVDSLKDVAACRLVCKAWDSLAERSMFKRDYKFTTVAVQRKYYKQLVKKPALVPLVKSIYVLPKAEPDFYINLIKLVFRPHIKKIEGNAFWDQDELNKELHNVVRLTTQYEAGNYTLKYLVTPYPWSYHHVETFLFFKRSLVRLVFMFGGNENDTIQMALLDRRREFESLRCIILTIYHKASLIELENMLNKCSPIQELVLDIDSMYLPTMEKEGLQEWLILHVKKDTSVRRLHLTSEKNLQYLLFKYPQITAVDIHDIDPDDQQTDLSITSVLGALKGLARSRIAKRVVDTMQTLEALIPFMKSPNNTLVIGRNPYDAFVHRMFIARRFKLPSEITDFFVCIPRGQPLQALERIISHVSNVTSLEIAYGPHEDWKLDNQVSYLYPVLETTAPHIEKLTFQDVDIQCPPPDYNPPHLRHLHHLEIKGAIVDKLVLSSLSTMAPNLQCLILNTCLLDTKCYQDYQLMMPNTNFTRISIVTADLTSCSETTDCLKKKIDLKDGQMMTVKLTTLADQKTRHYVLKAGIPTRYKQVSLEDYNHIENHWPKTVITCKSILYLKFDLGKLGVILNVEVGKGRIEPLGDWNQANRGFLLSWFHGN